MTLSEAGWPPRDFRGYGRNLPDADWPGKARVAVLFVLNYEEGGERCILDGDATSEAFLSEIVNAEPWAGQRHMNVESIYEYGARAGFWRLWRLFTARAIPVTVNAVARALATAPEQTAAMGEAGWEICSHGLKWIDHRDLTIPRERADLAEAIRLQRHLTGARPLGFYAGRNSVNTLDLVTAEGGFVYSADSYADDLPYYVTPPGRAPHLIVPYALDTNDMRFLQVQGYQTSDEFFQYLRDSFDTLYAEGADKPRMMSIGLHCRIIGRPGRIVSLFRFLDHIAGKADVWTPRRIDLARHWLQRHPPAPVTGA